MDLGRQLNRRDDSSPIGKRGRVQPREKSEDAKMQRDRQNQPDGNPIRPVPFERLARVLVCQMVPLSHFSLTFFIHVQTTTHERSVLEAGAARERDRITPPLN
jgi:hypothetical protein